MLDHSADPDLSVRATIRRRRREPMNGCHPGRALRCNVHMTGYRYSAVLLSSFPRRHAWRGAISLFPARHILPSLPVAVPPDRMPIDCVRSGLALFARIRAQSSRRTQTIRVPCRPGVRRHDAALDGRGAQGTLAECESAHTVKSRRPRRGKPERRLVCALHGASRAIRSADVSAPAWYFSLCPVPPGRYDDFGSKRPLVNNGSEV